MRYCTLITVEDPLFIARTQDVPTSALGPIGKETAIDQSRVAQLPWIRQAGQSTNLEKLDSGRAGDGREDGVVTIAWSALLGSARPLP